MDYTNIDDLQPGDCVWTPIVLDTADIVTAFSSTNARKARAGQAVPRIAVVVDITPAGPKVAYLATFKKAASLPLALDKKLWCPVKPAPKEGGFNPVDVIFVDKSPVAQWVSLRRMHDIKGNTVQKLSTMKFPPAAIEEILAAIHAADQGPISLDDIPVEEPRMSAPKVLLKGAAAIEYLENYGSGEDEVDVTTEDHPQPETFSSVKRLREDEDDGYAEASHLDDEDDHHKPLKSTTPSHTAKRRRMASSQDTSIMPDDKYTPVTPAPATSPGSSTVIKPETSPSAPPPPSSYKRS